MDEKAGLLVDDMTLTPEVMEVTDLLVDTSAVVDIMVEKKKLVDLGLVVDNEVCVMVLDALL